MNCILLLCSIPFILLIQCLTCVKCLFFTKLFKNTVGKAEDLNYNLSVVKHLDNSSIVSYEE